MIKFALEQINTASDFSAFNNCTRLQGPGNSSCFTYQKVHIFN